MSPELQAIDGAPPRLQWKTLIVVISMNFISSAQFFGVIGAGFLALQTSILFGQPSIASWLPQILTIFTLAFNIPLSQAADYWGRKWIIVICSLGGTVGPIVISRAQNVVTLIVGQCIFGLAFTCQSLFYAVVSEVLPRKYRSIGQSSINFSTAIAALLAILATGLLMRDGNPEHYRIFWYITLGLYTVGNLGIIFMYNPPPRELESTLTGAEKLKKFDRIGFLLVAAGLTLFCVGLTWSSNPYGWDDAHVAAPFALSIALLITFGLYEWRGNAEGLMNHALFQDRNFSIALFSMFMEGLSFFTINSYLVREVMLFYSSDLLVASTPFIVIFAVAMIMSPLVGLYTTITKSLRTPLVVGFVSLTLCNALMASLKPDSPKGCAWGYPVFAGLGLSIIIVNSMVAAQMSTSADLLSVTSGFVVSARGVGGAVGMAINNAIFNRSVEPNLGKKMTEALVEPFNISPDRIAAAIRAFESQSQELIGQVLDGNATVIDAAYTAYKEGYSIAFRNTWVTAACFGAAGIVFSAFLRDPKSRFDEHIEAALQEDLIRYQTGKENMEGTVDHNENVQRFGEKA